jgi:hypothetical protein
MLPARTLGTLKRTNNPVKDISIDPIPPGKIDITPITLASKNITIIAMKLILTLNAYDTV